MAVFSIPSSAVFLDVLADRILQRYHRLTDPLALRRVRIVLPTKRACRQFAEALKRQTTTPIILPQMHTLTEELSTNTTEQESQADNLPRLLRFFSFLHKFLRARHLFPPPCTLFSSLPAIIALLEEAFLYEMSESSTSLLSEKAELFWTFYKAVSQNPELMATLKSVQRLATLKEIETQIRAHPEDPVVLAGVTAIFPKMLEMFRLVGESAHNMIILPEIVPNLGKSLEPEHPQYALHTILEALDCSPEGVIPLEKSGDRRIRSIFQALTEGEKQNKCTSAELLGHVSLIESAYAQEEAFIIALLLRESFSASAQTAALVTPDPDLVQRVEEHLKRWNLMADVSQTRSLASSSAGVFALLCADVIEENFADIPFLALLKHPFSFLPLKIAWNLERDLRRGVLASLLEESSVLSDIKSLVEMAPSEEASFADFVLFHEHLFTSCLSLAQATNPETTALIEFFRHLKGMHSFSLTRSAYKHLFLHLLKTQTWQEKKHVSPRLFIWGPLEARLLHVDRLILGGLNEEAWITTKNRWLSPKDRQHLGLPFQDQKVGFLTHDFAMAFGTQEVFLTRSCAVQDKQTIPVSWLKCLEAYFGDLHPWRKRATRYKRLARYAYGQKERTPSVRPIVSPPLSDRPKTLPVTHIALLMRNPYAVYARHILGLVLLENLSQDPVPLLRGKYVHTVLEYMVHHHPTREEEARPFLDHLLQYRFPLPESLLYWKYRLENIFMYCLQKFIENGKQGVRSYTEIRGSLDFPDLNFTLTGIADRIDLFPSGGVRIIDYKTGELPSKEEVQYGLAPQLPLEAVIATFGAFPPLSANPVEALAFWHLKGNFSACSEVFLENVEVESVRAGLTHLLRTYQTCGYAAYPLEAIAPAYDAYAHLARVKEWI